MTDNTNASEEQITYANILNIGMWIGLCIIVITFIIYIFGILPCFISIENISTYWGMKANDYIHTLNVPTGWKWITLVGKGDYMNFIGITILASLSIICYLVILPLLIKKKDISYVVIILLQVVVLVFAASGMLKGGGH